MAATKMLSPRSLLLAQQDFVDVVVAADDSEEDSDGGDESLFLLQCDDVVTVDDPVTVDVISSSQQPVDFENHNNNDDDDDVELPIRVRDDDDDDEVALMSSPTMTTPLPSLPAVAAAASIIAAQQSGPITSTPNNSTTTTPTTNATSDPTNFRLCSVVTLPLVNNPAASPSSYSSPNPSSRNNNEQANFFYNNVNNNDIIDDEQTIEESTTYNNSSPFCSPSPPTPSYIRSPSAKSIEIVSFIGQRSIKQKKHTAARPPSIGAIRRFDQQPPPPMSVLYSSLTDLLSPRYHQLATKTATNTETIIDDDPTAPPDGTKVRMALSGGIPNSAFRGYKDIHAYFPSPRHSSKPARFSRRRKTPDSLISSSMSDDSSSEDSASDNDAETTLGSQRSEHDEPAASASRRRNLALHSSSSRRPLERVLSSPDSAINKSSGVDTSTESLTSLLRVRQLRSQTSIGGSLSRSYTSTPLVQPQAPSNSALAFSIREMFLKHFGQPPVTVISAGSSKLRDSIFRPEVAAATTATASSVIAQPVQPLPRPLTTAPPVIHKPKRMKSALPVAAQSAGNIRQVGVSNKDEGGNSSSPASNSSPYSSSQRYDNSSTPGRSRTGGRNGDPGGDDMGDAPDPPDGRRPAATRAPRVSLVGSQLPTYYIGGHNGSALVEAPLLTMGWKRITDKNSDTFRFKWCDIKASINYSAFREGEQLVNHIPNSQLLTNKLGLLNSLQDYDRQLAAAKRRGCLRLNQFYPETYRLDDRADRDAFLSQYKDGEIWICKPTGLNQGIGIHLVRTTEEARALAEDRENRMTQARGQVRQPMTRIVQRYILRPLLLEGRKFDIRCYMLIACTSPWLVLYHKGYIRLSIHTYHPDSPNLTVHLTNQYIQKKDSAYKDAKESTAWSMDQFNTYVNEHMADAKGIERDWAYNTMTRQIQRIIVHIFSAVKNKLSSKVGFFELYGLDFMVDDNMKVYLIEVNTNPSLSTNCTALAEVIPNVVSESVGLTIECFEKARRGQPLMPLKSLQGFNVLFHGSRRTIDFGPGDPAPPEAEEGALENVWPRPRLMSGSSNFNRILKRAMSSAEVLSPGRPQTEQSGQAFESSQALQRFQQKIVERGPNLTSGKVFLPSGNYCSRPSVRVALRYSTPGNILASSVDAKDATADGSNSQAMARRSYNWPAREPISQLMKRKQDPTQKVPKPPATAPQRRGDVDEDLFSPPSTGHLTRSVLVDDPLFKPFRVIIVEESNSPPPDRSNASSVRRTRSLSPVKVNQPPGNSTAASSNNNNSNSNASNSNAQRNNNYNPSSPKLSPGPPQITPRPRTVRQTLSTSVATVRVANNLANNVFEGTEDLTPVASTSPTTMATAPATDNTTSTTNNTSNNATATSGGTALRYSFNSGLATPSAMQRQVTFAPMTLPTVRLQLTQVQFPYPVIAGQTIASVPASALASNATSPTSSVPLLSPYHSRMKAKERKDRGN